MPLEDSMLNLLNCVRRIVEDKHVIFKIMVFVLDVVHYSLVFMSSTLLLISLKVNL